MGDNMLASDVVFVLDVDGVLTNGLMHYTKEGKFMKSFGGDDWDALKLLAKHVQLCFVTADRKGFDITQKRIEEEMNFDLNLVSHKPKDRWDWIQNKFPNKKIFFMGDGIFDWYSLRYASYAITTNDSLPHVQQYADYTTGRTGGNRAVAEACIHIMDLLKIDWKMGE